ncbi:hypothetical protein MXD62_37780, partial [Frankia sp. Mgl5]|nr:hypothetical protein [Frankia sp. Mgl5]
MTTRWGVMEADQIQAAALRALPGTGDGVCGPTPETLLARTGRGDTDAFGALYDQLAARVYGLVGRGGGGPGAGGGGAPGGVGGGGGGGPGVG